MPVKTDTVAEAGLLCCRLHDSLPSELISYHNSRCNCAQPSLIEFTVDNSVAFPMKSDHKISFPICVVFLF